jgi:drug/metabolite transporter (DMT)-like permease
MAGILVVVGEPAPTPSAALLALLAGASGVAGLGFFYFALARGTMGVVAPLAAVVGAGVPVLVAVVGGEEMGVSRLAGISIALIAVVLIAFPSSSQSDPLAQRSLRADLADVPYAVMSGLGFAGFFIFVDLASSGTATWWPLTLVRIAGLALVIAALVVAMARTRATNGTLRSRLRTTLGVERFRESGRPRALLIGLLVLTGLGDVGGNSFFLLATQSDALSVAVVLASLYPVFTTLLAAAFLHERLSRWQVLGVVLATLSVPLLR